MSSIANQFINLVKTQVEQETFASLEQIQHPIIKETSIGYIRPQIDYLYAPAKRIIPGGKFFRACLLIASYWACKTELQDAHSALKSENDSLILPNSLVDYSENLPHSALLAGVALELFQLQALIHDDIVDRAVSRRGIRCAHLDFADTLLPKKFCANNTNNLNGVTRLGDCKSSLSPIKDYPSGSSNSQQTESAHLGTSMALLLGDSILSIANLKMTAATANLSEKTSKSARAVFDTMTLQVALGQMLDLKTEVEALNANTIESIKEQAVNVALNKSASYSVESPITIGAILAETEDANIPSLQKSATAAGVAFQLRDDEIGIFGSTKDTGKGAGDDLREGKRTVLLLLTFAKSNHEQRKWLHTVIGNPNITSAQIQEFQSLAHSSGAYAEHESLIKYYENLAINYLECTSISSAGKKILQSFYTRLAHRQA